jgi:hypothetical protein
MSFAISIDQRRPCLWRLGEIDVRDSYDAGRPWTRVDRVDDEQERRHIASIQCAGTAIDWEEFADRHINRA